MVDGKTPLTEVLFQEGIISTLLGMPGAGKTNVATYLMQKAAKHGFSIYTNIHFFDFKDVPKAIKTGRLPPLPGEMKYEGKPESIQTVTNISDLLMGLFSTTRNTVVIDEAGFFATSTAATSKKVRQLKELSFIIRHLNSSFLLIAQSKGSIVPDLRKTLVEYELDIEKLSKKYRALAIKRYVPSRNYTTGEKEKVLIPIDRIGGVPMATIPWDGYFLPKFKFDIDLSEAFDEFGEYNSIEILKEGPRILRELKSAKKEGKSKRDVKRAKQYEEVRETFKMLEDSGMFKNRTALLAHLASHYRRTSQWAYMICRDLPFDKSKYTTGERKS